MLVKLFGSLFLVLLILGAIFYASGWVQFQSNGDTTTIEMNTGEIKEAADKAIDKSKELIDKAGDKIQQLGDDRSNSDSENLDRFKNQDD